MRFPWKKSFGGNAGESNPPETFLTPHIGFEDRGLHQHATHFRGQYVDFGAKWQVAKIEKPRDPSKERRNKSQYRTRKCSHFATSKVRNPQENQGHPEVKSVKINAKRKPIITISLHRASAPKLRPWLAKAQVANNTGFFIV